MLVIPRFEIQTGALTRGSTAGQPASDHPAATARAWVSDGYGRLLMVDRDAIGGHRPNYGLVESLARDVGVEVDIAAAADSTDQIEAWLDSGASRVVLGARALSENDWLRSTAEVFPAALIVETSVRERRVTTRGWVRTLSIDLLDLVEELAGLPIAALIITAPPGTSSPELALLEDVADASSFPVLVEDAQPTVSALRAFEHRGVAGVVVPAGALATALDPRAVANEFVR
ncbi:MAG TPA: HisA/HisF-related TIM barrel protein [Gemmatimonadaceae bacterium]|jgi:phosphoribosylformimino-5-aminoimidazole carboxamide ribotide isomerase|nr:HisA/HisF-related TIM barrel protein [Gemmatimonadaceae bacterium]